ncbi:MAG: TFIIB-type zinc ribbon-containing protein [Methanomassiliicoccales archaeon]|nr:TFIIB-type zinc ribbon-containing protein [Methanomassiliicoccales archaeon]
MTDEQREAVLLLWRAERESHPNPQEMEMWERTISNLHAKGHETEDPAQKADIFHRLVMANIKMKDYGSALGWAEKGLQLGLLAWRDRFLIGKAEVLFLLGRQRESMEVLNDVYPIVPPVICPLDGGEVRPKKVITSLAVSCPDCGRESDYGSRSCPGCGRVVDECFHLVKRSREVLGPNSKGTECQLPKKHRSKELTLFHTTYTVDFDDKDHYLTGSQQRVMGTESVSTTTRKWTLWPFLLAIIGLSLIFILAEVLISDTGNDLLMISLAILWVMVLTPLLLFLRWAFIAPSDPDVEQKIGHDGGTIPP